MTCTFPLFTIPLLIPVFPIFATLQYFPYPFMSQNLLLFSTSLVFYLGQLVHHPFRPSGIGHHLLCDVPNLSSGLSFVQMVGFSLVALFFFLSLLNPSKGDWMISIDVEDFFFQINTYHLSR